MLGETETVGCHWSLVEKLNLNRGIVLSAPEFPTSRVPKNI